MWGLWDLVKITGGNEMRSIEISLWHGEVENLSVREQERLVLSRYSPTRDETKTAVNIFSTDTQLREQ